MVGRRGRLGIKYIANKHDAMMIFKQISVLWNDASAVELVSWCWMKAGRARRRNMCIVCIYV